MERHGALPRVGVKNRAYAPFFSVSFLSVLSVLSFLSVPASASWFWQKWFQKDETEDAVLEETQYGTASQIYQKSGADKAPAIRAFSDYITRCPRCVRVPDAWFMIGESYLDEALAILQNQQSQEPGKKGALAVSAQSQSALGAFDAAKGAFAEVARRDTPLAASALYRLGEISYDQKKWEDALFYFGKVQEQYPKSYLIGESLMGSVFANLALERFGSVQTDLYSLGESLPHYLSQPAALYAQGIVSLQKGDFGLAEKSFQLVKTPESEYYLGRTYLASQRPYRAVSALEAFQRDYPKDPLREETYLFLGDSFFLAQDYDGAIVKYNQFLTQFPQSSLKASALFRLGACYFEKKSYLEARTHFQDLLDKNKDEFYTPLAQYFVGESFLADGDMRQAMFAYGKVISNYPTSSELMPLSYLKLAWTQVQLGNDAQAVQTADDFLTIYPSHEVAKDVYMIKGQALLRMKRSADAAVAFQRVIDLDPSSRVAEQALFEILRYHYDEKDYTMMLTSDQDILRHLLPSRSKWRSLSYLYLADAYLQTHQTDDARAIEKMILDDYPDDPSALYAQDGLAWAYTEAGDDAKALEARRQLQDMLANATQPMSFAGLNGLGMADSYFNQKNYDDAYQLYQKFVSDNPKAPEAPTALYRQGLSLYYQRFYSEAVAAWQKLEVDYPKAPETKTAAYQISDTLFRQQKYDQAIAAYEAIIKNYPSDPRLPLADLRIAQAEFNRKDDSQVLTQIHQLLLDYPSAPEATDSLDYLEAVFDRSKSFDYRKFLGDLIAANKTSPAASQLQFRLARRLFEDKDYEAAAKEFQKFSVDYADSPDLAKAQFYLGESYFAAKDFDNAIPAFERLLTNFDKDDNSPLALFHLASSYFSVKKYDEAAADYLTLTQQHASSPYAKSAQFNLALSYKAAHKFDAAQDAYQKYAAMAAPGDSSALQAFWETYSIQRNHHDYPAAIETLKKIFDSVKPGAPEQMEATFRMSEVQGEMGRPDEAVNSWKALQSMKPLDNPFRLQALINLGQAYEKASDFADAVAVYEDIARNSPNKDNARAAAQRAASLRKSGGKG